MSVLIQECIFNILTPRLEFAITLIAPALVGPSAPRRAHFPTDSAKIADVNSFCPLTVGAALMFVCRFMALLSHAGFTTTTLLKQVVASFYLVAVDPTSQQPCTNHQFRLAAVMKQKISNDKAAHMELLSVQV